MKTHFNYIFIQIKRLISSVCAFVVLGTLDSSLHFLDDVNFQNLKDVIEASPLETNGTSFYTAKNVDFPAIFRRLKEERKKEEAEERTNKEVKEAWYIALSPSRHFPASGQVDDFIQK